MESGKKCSVTECHNMAIARGMCDTHYCRWKRHGHVEPTRPPDWGSRQKHPLLKTWAWLLRSQSPVVCERWKDFWLFVQDLGDSRPSKRHRLSRKDSSTLMGPENFYWREPRICTSSPEARAQAAAFSREWYRANTDKARNGKFLQVFGITLAQYDAMLESQSGVCLICQKPETRIDNRTGKPSRLAVDHCHGTKKVRGLLCSACNKGIGHFKDSPTLLRQAALYLEAHNE